MIEFFYCNLFHPQTLGFFAIVAYIGSLVSAVQDWRLSRQMMQQTPGGSTAATGPFSGQQEPPAFESQYWTRSTVFNILLRCLYKKI